MSVLSLDRIHLVFSPLNTWSILISGTDVIYSLADSGFSTSLSTNRNAIRSELLRHRLITNVILNIFDANSKCKIIDKHKKSADVTNSVRISSHREWPCLTRSHLISWTLYSPPLSLSIADTLKNICACRIPAYYNMTFSPWKWSTSL